MPQYLRDGAVVWVFDHTVTPPVAPLRYENIQDSQSLLRPRMRNSIFLDSGCCLACKQICMNGVVLGVYTMRSCEKK